MSYTLDEAIAIELVGQPMEDCGVYYAPATMRAVGALVSAAIPLMTTTGVVANAIITDRMFDKLSDNAKQFVINHERGHIRCHDAEKLVGVTHKKYLLACVLGCPAIERAADAYASEVIGFENALSAMKELMTLNVPMIAKFQIAKRYIALCLFGIRERVES